MMPDIKTVMLLYLIVNIINTGAMAVIWGQNRGRFAGISFWLVGMALQAAGPLLLILRGLVPDLISMTGSNTIVLAGILIIFTGLERFSKVKSRQIHNYVLLAVFIAVSAYFVVVQPNLMARDIAVTAIIMIYTFQCCWLLLRRVDHGMRRVTRLTGIVFAIYAAFSFARIILTIIIPEKSNDFFNSGAVNALAITGYILLNICLTISLVLMVNNRLMADFKAQEGKYRLLVENINDVLYTLDNRGNITYVSSVVERLSNYKVSDLIGKPFTPIVYPDDLPALLDSFNRLTSGHLEPWEFRIVDKDGRIIFVRTSSRPIYDDGKIVGFTALMTDITERKRMEQKLEEMATHDFLTGLPNRVLLTDRFSVAAALAHRNKVRLAVMTLDLDNFKAINDTLGHAAGDQVLKTVSARLTGIIRASDTLARIGGDEFILVMLESNHKNDASAIAQKTLDAFAEPLLIDGQQVQSSTSIGIAIYPEDAEDLETLIKKSDAAMYYSKQHGRNQFKFFSDGDVRVGGDHKSAK
jgi:diguanylate cyclase (GGDEF)-like protein/PAS domain S-box-containing protein